MQASETLFEAIRSNRTDIVTALLSEMAASKHTLLSVLNTAKVLLVFLNNLVILLSFISVTILR